MENVKITQQFLRHKSYELSLSLNEFESIEHIFLNLTQHPRHFSRCKNVYHRRKCFVLSDSDCQLLLNLNTKYGSVALTLFPSSQVK